MNITSFKISQDKSTLELELVDAGAATSLKLWTNKTYKTEGLEIDLSAKLGTNSITITLEDLGISYFDGVYFIEITNPSETVCGIAAELTKYKECVIEEVLANTECSDCKEQAKPSILNKHTLLRTLELALELAQPQKILNIVFALDRLCNNDCNGCSKYKEL
jgi:hypothetical protein